MSHPEVSDIDQEDTSTMEESKLNTPDDEGPPERNLDIEEGKDAYRKGRFHPGYIGDIYNERYEVLCKIGYGRYSTVWLVKDLTQEYVPLYEIALTKNVNTP
jgi:serine/threonine-protein kinase SRPK3